MTRFVLVRHAEPVASWGEHPDPGLSPAGRDQAEVAAVHLESRGPIPIVTSPLVRARETAAALTRRWGLQATVDEAVGEIPTPASTATPRGEWLRSVLARRWPDVEEGARRWRTELLDTLRTVEDPVVIFTHFVAINVVVGAATGDDRVWSCSPAHASRTEIDVDGTGFALVSLGDQATTRIG